MYNVLPQNNYYGGFRTRTFSDIFSSEDIFLDELKECKIPQIIPDDKVKTIYYLLYAQYGDSHVKATNENQFKYSLFSLIFSNAPAWDKEIQIQTELYNLSLDASSDLYAGGKAIYNSAYNPGTRPSTSTLEELTAINQQNTTNYKKSKVEGLSILASLLKTDVTAKFIRVFANLFIDVLYPDYPLYYVTQTDITEGEN